MRYWDFREVKELTDSEVSRPPGQSCRRGRNATSFNPSKSTGSRRF
ncbi:hypothetical protein HNP73_004255 [Amaricoccus macauensis]|uniref:Uncharacterized protein n=1 Tax=Amaricoccus macauensis TaxID=57001 RepID=A0A840SWV4_9RHOB|nr:hypothetical protein [Amaricoccus macauensis]